MLKSLSVIVTFFFLSLGVATGCATQSVKNVKTETVQHAAARDQDTPEPVVAEKQTTETTETTKTEGESFGLLSGAVHVAGQVLALPFRLAGGLIGFIF